MIKISKLTILGALLLTIPAFSADMVFEKKENILLKGKIATVKTSKKYRNLEACQALCESRSSCAAYTLDTNKGSCSIFKNVSNRSIKIIHNHKITHNKTPLYLVIHKPKM